MPILQTTCQSPLEGPHWFVGENFLRDSTNTSSLKLDIHRGVTREAQKEIQKATRISGGAHQKMNHLVVGLGCGFVSFTLAWWFNLLKATGAHTEKFRNTVGKYSSKPYKPELYGRDVSQPPDL
eukprot:g3423.t1